MRIVPIPLNTDNYGYLLFDESTSEGAIVDVSSQPGRCLEVLSEHGVKLLKILTTHHHMDHAGGNAEFLSAFGASIEILGSSVDNCEGCTRVVENNETFLLTKNIRVTCLLTPGHTMGHISYFAENISTSGDEEEVERGAREKAVFTGDCLFIGGAGKFFEGTGEDMYFALYEQLGKLPPDTKVFCGHEYTLSNYKFALSIDGENQDLIEANARAQGLRTIGQPTVPSTIEVELKTNPFLRADSVPFRVKFGGSTVPETLSAIRAAKNKF